MKNMSKMWGALLNNNNSCALSNFFYLFLKFGWKLWVSVTRKRKGQRRCKINSRFSKKVMSPQSTEHWFRSVCAHRAFISRPRHRVLRAQSRRSEDAETKAHCQESSTWWDLNIFTAFSYFLFLTVNTVSCLFAKCHSDALLRDLWVINKQVNTMIHYFHTAAIATNNH